MKLIVDVNLTESAPCLNQEDPKLLALMLSKSKVHYLDMPLEAKVSTDFGLKANLDYPLASLAAKADSVNVSTGFWLRCDPVNFAMQRDAFTLAAPVPMRLKMEASKALLASLNAHFQDDGLTFALGTSGHWYLGVNLQLRNRPLISTSMPHEALQKNVEHFFPQGDDAKEWVAIVNEVQMLLFDHPVNQQRESRGELAVNAVWLSAGGEYPAAVHAVPLENQTILAGTPCYEGLASYSNMNFIPIGDVKVTADFLKASNNDVRVALDENADIDAWFALFHDFLKRRIIKELTLNLGWYEKTINTRINTRDLYQFWRKAKPLTSFLK